MDSRLGNSTGLVAILPFGIVRSVCGGAIEGINWILIIGVAGCLLRMRNLQESKHQGLGIIKSWERDLRQGVKKNWQSI
jgi:hypothetical protein